jgi:hypothetical protein
MALFNRKRISADRLPQYAPDDPAPGAADGSERRQTVVTLLI